MFHRSGISGAVGAVGALLIVGYWFTVSLIVRPVRSDAPEDPTASLEEAAPEAVRHREAFRVLAAKAKVLAPACTKRDREHVLKLDSKFLIWDATTDDLSDAHGRLPAELRAKDPGDDVTVFLITERTRKHVINYNHGPFSGGGDSGVMGFRVDLIICPVDLTRMQPLGRYRISCDPPYIARAKPGQTEVEGDWVLAVKNFAAHWATGPEPLYFQKPFADQARAADAAKAVLAVCESMGSTAAFPLFPRELLIWDARRDRTHPANGRLAGGDHLRGRDGVIFLVLDEAYVPGGRTARIDTTVAVVLMPAVRPLGVYSVRGQDWPAPDGVNKDWADRDPAGAVAAWAREFVRNPAAVVQSNRTVRLPPGSTALTARAQAQAPGWLDKPKRPPPPKDQEGYYRTAEQAKPAVAACRAKGPILPTQKLPSKALIWYADDEANSSQLHGDHHVLPPARKAGPADSEVVVFCILGMRPVYERNKRGLQDLVGFDYPVAVVAMPGATPVGLYTIHGLKNGEPRDQDGRDRSVRDWVVRFMDAPASAVGR
jgi:hypothetical protein